MGWVGRTNTRQALKITLRNEGTASVLQTAAAPSRGSNDHEKSRKMVYFRAKCIETQI